MSQDRLVIPRRNSNGLLRFLSRLEGISRMLSAALCRRTGLEVRARRIAKKKAQPVRRLIKLISQRRSTLPSTATKTEKRF
jgi:hypothetical protein